MEPCLTKSTYESCWHFIAGICPWEYNFADNSSASLQFYFLKANFITMTALMFKLISAEEELNRGLPVTAVPRKDRTMRETIRQVYQDLAYNPRFVDVDRSIFQFEDQVRVRRRTLAPVDYMLDHYLLVADEPPPLPAGLKVSRTPIPPFFPPASDASGSDSRGQKRRHPGGLSGQNAPHPNPHPSRRSSKQKRSPAPSHSSLGLSGNDDDENELASSSRRQRGSNHRSQQHHSRIRIIPLRNRHMRTSSSTQTTTMSRTTLRCSARVRVCALSRFAEVSATAYAAANCDEQSWVCWRAFTGVPI